MSDQIKILARCDINETQFYFKLDKDSNIALSDGLIMVGTEACVEFSDCSFRASG